jgi:hypothetical protein
VSRAGPESSPVAVKSPSGGSNIRNRIHQSDLADFLVTLPAVRSAFAGEFGAKRVTPSPNCSAPRLILRWECTSFMHQFMVMVTDLARSCRPCRILPDNDWLIPIFSPPSFQVHSFSNGKNCKKRKMTCAVITERGDGVEVISRTARDHLTSGWMEARRKRQGPDG